MPKLAKKPSRFTRWVNKATGIMESTINNEMYDSIAKIPGWLTVDEGKLLHHLSKDAEVVVEEGSWLGRSTCFMATGLKDGGKNGVVYAVDPHTGSSEHKTMFGDGIDTYPEFLENLERAGVENQVVPIKNYAEKAAKIFKDNSIDLVFIDAEHTFKDVKKDFKTWFPKVKAGGKIVFHDMHFPAPNWVTTRALLSGKAKNPGHVDTTTYFEKEDGSIVDRIKNIPKNLLFLAHRNVALIEGFKNICKEGTGTLLWDREAGEKARQKHKGREDRELSQEKDHTNEKKHGSTWRMLVANPNIAQKGSAAKLFIQFGKQTAAGILDKLSERFTPEECRKLLSKDIENALANKDITSTKARIASLLSNKCEQTPEKSSIEDTHTIEPGDNKVPAGKVKSHVDFQPTHSSR